MHAAPIAELLPQPGSWEAAEAVFLLAEHSSVLVDASDAEAHPLASQLAKLLRRVSGHDVPIRLGEVRDAEFGSWILRLRPERTEFGEEGYRIRIEPEQLRLVAATRAGLLNALHTVEQLLPSQAPPRTAPRRDILLQCLRVEDSPAHPVRQLNLQLGKRRPSKSTLMDLVPLLARHKFNRLSLSGDLHGYKADTLEALRLECRRTGVLLATPDQGPETPDGTVAQRVLLEDPRAKSWSAMSEGVALQPGNGGVDAHLAYDDVPEGQLDAWLWPRLLCVAEAFWSSAGDSKAGPSPAALRAALLRLTEAQVRWQLPTPELLTQQVVFSDSLDLSQRLQTSCPAAEVRVSFDGEAPTSHSARLRDELPLRESCTVRARLIPIGAAAPEHAGEELVFSLWKEAARPPDMMTPAELTPGVHWETPTEGPLHPRRTQPGQPWRPSPLIAAGRLEQLGCPPAAGHASAWSQFEVRFEAWFEVAQEGAYALRALSSGELSMRLVPEQLVQNRFPFIEVPLVPKAAPTERPAEFVLAPGLHRIELTWYPVSDSDSLSLEWLRTDQPSDWNQAESLPLMAPPASH